MNTNIYISEIVATRLSHDLIGNIGAVANAVELLNEGDEDDREDIGNILNFSSKVSVSYTHLTLPTNREV